ncbi:hypothetical protein BGZ98_003000 [Dissophora globulifera]|nr:hypothetical protein BGZ98_003000 [Dissophora globulifera]
MDELTKFVQTSMGYQKPYFILYISHSFWAIILPIQFLSSVYLSPSTLQSHSSLRERIDYFACLIRESTSDLNRRKTDYILVGTAPEPTAASAISTSATSSVPGTTVYTSREKKSLAKRLFWVTFGMTTLFMIPSYLWYTCVAMTSMSNLTAIYNTACFFAYLFSVLLLREKIVLNKVLAVFLSLVGVAIISLTSRDGSAPEGEDLAPGINQGAVAMTGNVLALIGAALYGFEEVVYKKYASPKVQPIVFANTLTGLMGVVTCTMLWVPIPLLHWMGHEVFELPTLNEFTSILMIAALGLIYNGCFMIVVSQTSPVFAAVGVMATIPLVALTDWVLFNEIVGWGNIIGGLSILAGFGILVRENRKAQTLAPKLNGSNLPSKQGAAGIPHAPGKSNNSVVGIGSSSSSGSNNSNSGGSNTKVLSTSTIARTGPGFVPSTNVGSISRSDGGIVPSPLTRQPRQMPTPPSAAVSHLTNHATNNGASTAQVKNVQEQDRRGFSRSNSTPTAGPGSATHHIRNKRRLPGPAGNLPKLSPEEKEQLFRARGVPVGNDTRNLLNGSVSPNSSIKKKMKSVHHGPIDSMFANGAWEEMLKTYGLPDYKPSTLSLFKGAAPLIELSLSDIESRQELHRGKIPKLVVMVKEVVFSEIDAAVTLMDPSGEMRGTIHKTVLEKYKNNEIRIGTVLALENVSVFSPTAMSHYLIITIRNIDRIFKPHPPTIILSQGSSQDRLSQKKKLASNNQDSQESSKSSQGQISEHSNASNPQSRVNDHGDIQRFKSSSVSSSPPVTSNAKTRRSPSPDWVDIPDETDLLLSPPREVRGTTIPGVASQDHQQSVIQSESTNQNDHPRSPSARQQSSKKQRQEDNDQRSESTSQGSSVYRHEVQFQSLRQTFGDSSMAPAVNTQTQPYELSATPLITLGAMTPNNLDSSASPAVGSRSVLSSFAAPTNIRKRSMLTMSNQRTGSSGSSVSSFPSKPGMGETPSSPDARTTRGAPTDSFSLSSDPTSSLSSIEVQRPSVLERTLSSDWLDDFGEVDFAKVLEEDLSTSSITDIHTIEPPSDPPRAATERSGFSPVSLPPTSTSAVNVDDDDDDDLDNLLDGLDEAELFDL